jgi:hypothetical protein
MAEVIGRHNRLAFQFAEADLIANNPLELVSPFEGFVYGLRPIVQKTVTTGGTLTVKNFRTGSAVTVAGLSVTVANGATKGTVPTPGVSTPGDTSLYVKVGDRLQIFPGGFATAGALNGVLSIADADVSGAKMFPSQNGL